MLESTLNDQQQKAQNLIFLALSQGPQATSGYQLLLSSPTKVLGEDLLIPVHWQTPPENSMQAQVITHPCLIVALEWPGEGSIKFVDQLGQTLASYTNTTPATLEPLQPAL
ncbi:MAG: protease complex subunit PrcB family protein [Pseudomonadales bacterium]|nr:protease complex subunit PrcB family protein [Pseudomonadales bacterium]